MYRAGGLGPDGEHEAMLSGRLNRARLVHREGIFAGCFPGFNARRSQRGQVHQSSSLTWARTSATWSPQPSHVVFAQRAHGTGLHMWSLQSLVPFRYHSNRGEDRKSTRLNSSHVATSYAVFCLKKKISTASMYEEQED